MARLSRLPSNRKKRAIRIKQLDRKENVTRALCSGVKNLLIQELFRRSHYAQRMRSYRSLGRYPA